MAERAPRDDVADFSENSPALPHREESLPNSPTSQRDCYLTLAMAGICPGDGGDNATRLKANLRAKLAAASDNGEHGTVTA